MRLFMTTAVSRRKQRGQSLVEFAFLVPIIIGMLQILVQVENAISTAIVNEKYSRGTLHFLAFNHRYYPEKKFLKLNDGGFMGRWWVGVDDNVNLESGSDIVPHAPERKIGLIPGANDGETGAEFEDVTSRQKIRIRVTSFICIPPLGTKDGGFLTEGLIGDQTFAGNYRYCAN